MGADGMGKIIKILNLKNLEKRILGRRVLGLIPKEPVVAIGGGRSNLSSSVDIRS